MKTEERVHAFSNGTAFGEWDARNCSRCTKWSEDASKCDLQMALSLAYMTDGTVTHAEAQRLFILGPMCSEFERDTSIPIPPPPAPLLAQIQRELEHAAEKLSEMTEEARGRCEYPESAGGWPEGEGANDLCDSVMAWVSVNTALDLVKQARALPQSSEKE